MGQPADRDVAGAGRGRASCPPGDLLGEEAHRAGLRRATGWDAAPVELPGGVAEGDDLGERIRIMLDSTKLLYDPTTMRNVTMSEYILKS